MPTLDNAPSEIISEIASWLDLEHLCIFRLLSRNSFHASRHIFGLRLKPCVMFERDSLETLRDIANRYGAFVSELCVHVLSPSRISEKCRHPQHALDQDLILDSGLVLLWFKSALELFKALRIVRIADCLHDAARLTYSLAHRSLPEPYMTHSTRESLRHTVLIVLTALSEAKVNLRILDILPSLSHKTCNNDGSTTCIHATSPPGLDFSDPYLSRPYFAQISKLMASLQCIRLHASICRDENLSPQLIQLITLARHLNRLDLWYEPDATILFQSLAQSGLPPTLQDLTLAGTVSDRASLQLLLANVGGSLRKLRFCHVMLLENAFSSEGWIALLDSIATSLSLHVLTLHCLGVSVRSDWKPLRNENDGSEAIAKGFKSPSLRDGLQRFAQNLEVNVDMETLWMAFSPNRFDDGCFRRID